MSGVREDRTQPRFAAPLTKARSSVIDNSKKENKKYDERQLIDLNNQARYAAIIKKVGLLENVTIGLI